MAFLPSPRRHPERDVRRTKEGTLKETRIAITELVLRAVDVLGRQVSDDLFTGPPDQNQQKI